MEKKWEEMSAKEKREARFKTWLSAEGVKFENPEAENTYKKAVMRFKDAVLMEKVPDRVPIFPLGTFFQTYLYGVTPYEAMYDYGKLVSAHIKYLKDYKPDYYAAPALVGSGKILEILGYKQYRWPGHGVSKESVYQYVEGEYMKAEDYPALIDGFLDQDIYAPLLRGLRTLSHPDSISVALGNRPGLYTHDSFWHSPGPECAQSLA